MSKTSPKEGFKEIGNDCEKQKNETTVGESSDKTACTVSIGNSGIKSECSKGSAVKNEANKIDEPGKDALPLILSRLYKVDYRN